MKLRSRHFLKSVTVDGVTHTLSFHAVDDGWFEGNVPEAVAQKCVSVSPNDYIIVEEEQLDKWTGETVGEVATAEVAAKDNDSPEEMSLGMRNTEEAVSNPNGGVAASSEQPTVEVGVVQPRGKRKQQHVPTA